MLVEQIMVEWILPGSRSLKEKRSRLSAIRHRLSKIDYLACHEFNDHHIHDRSAWSFVVIAANRAELDRRLNRLEQDLLLLVDGQICQIDRQPLF